MTLEMEKRKVLGLIEEYNAKSDMLTDDPDIATKINDVFNQVQFELARIKKIPKYVEYEVDEGESIDYDNIEKESGYAVYQIDKVRGIKHEFKAQGTIIKALEKGTIEIEFFAYPEAITDKTPGSYEFELSQDVLEIMPYGVAADLLKSDVSADHGKIYAERYEMMKQQLDPRYNMGSVYIEGGIN